MAGRLIVGLGSENVLEAGLRLHHTYGVPIIPGSALKGLASHYCHEIWGQRHDATASEDNQRFRCDGKHHKLLFGTTEDGGVITFHDAWIVPQSLSDTLHLDVMTPHHKKWQLNQAPPTDFDSPTPVTFLSVAGTFELRLSWSGPTDVSSDQAGAWTALAMRLLLEALAEWGVGGKTSSGYGRLNVESLEGGSQRSSVVQAKLVAPPKPGEMVEVQLLEERTKKGGWRATHEPSGWSGPIENTSDVPTDKNPGDKLKLTVKHASVSGRELTFRYPTAADEARERQPPRKGPSGFGRGNRRR
ncbi:MAG: type III-B CRISPR module RAMP protein Cmr6 [Candidatus Binataceae bacterium]